MEQARSMQVMMLQKNPENPHVEDNVTFARRKNSTTCDEDIVSSKDDEEEAFHVHVRTFTRTRTKKLSDALNRLICQVMDKKITKKSICD